MSDYKLFGTSGCHLCELAEKILTSLSVQGKPIPFEKVDIAEDDALMERYGILIPVFRRESDGKELNWPFAGEDVVQLLG